MTAITKGSRKLRWLEATMRPPWIPRRCAWPSDDVPARVALGARPQGGGAPCGLPGRFEQGANLLLRGRVGGVRELRASADRGDDRFEPPAVGAEVAPPQLAAGELLD